MTSRDASALRMRSDEAEGSVGAGSRASYATGLRPKRKRPRMGLRPMHVAMGCVLLTIGAMPFVNLVTVGRQFVHDHPINWFTSGSDDQAATSEIEVETSEADAGDFGGWGAEPPAAEPAHAKEPSDWAPPGYAHQADGSAGASAGASAGGSAGASAPGGSPAMDPGVGFGSFLESFGLSKRLGPAASPHQGTHQGVASPPRAAAKAAKASTKACGGVFLLVAVREDSWRARGLYRRTWLSPAKWKLRSKQSKAKELAEELPSMAYRFFLVEGEADQHEAEDEASGGGRGDTVVVPKLADGSAVGAGQVRGWVLQWALSPKRFEFRFLLFLDLGRSGPTRSPQRAHAQRAESGAAGEERGLLGSLAAALSGPSTQGPGASAGEGGGQDQDPGASVLAGTPVSGGYALVCLERVADELRYRPPERFLWATHECRGAEGGGRWLDRPPFQLMSQDVAELLVYAQSRLDKAKSLGSGARGEAQGAALSFDALLQSLKLTVLDDRLRIANASAPGLLFPQQRETIYQAKKKAIALRHEWGEYATSRQHRSASVELAEWAAAATDPNEPKPKQEKRTKPASRDKGPEPACKAMTMFLGLADELEVEALDYGNGNRTKPWKGFRDQIMRLGPVCDGALKLDDVGFTTDKADKADGAGAPAGPESGALLAGLDAAPFAGALGGALGSASGRSKQHGERDALAYHLLDPKAELFTSLERFNLLEKCGLDLDCVWAGAVAGAVRRWWHAVDASRASRCLRPDAHSKGPQCDAYKSRQFLGAALLKGPEKGWVLQGATRVGGTGGPLKRKQEEGQRAVSKDYASGAVLASFPGSGNTWSRMLLEYASGHYTGSIYNDITLMPVLPAEGVRTHEVLAWKAHTFPSQYVDNYRPAKVVLLVRHPIPALWSEFQRRLNVEAGSRGGGGHVAAVKALSASEKNSFKAWSKCMSCRWLQYITAHLLLAQTLPLKILLFERLAADTFAAMKEVLEFLGVADLDEDRVRCALELADHPLVHRPKANFTINDAFNAFPEQACVILRTIEQHEQGRVVMRLLGYGNSVKPPKQCLDLPAGEYFACADMLVEEFRGAQQCKLGASTPDRQGQTRTTKSAPAAWAGRSATIASAKPGAAPPPSAEVRPQHPKAPPKGKGKLDHPKARP